MKRTIMGITLLAIGMLLAETALAAPAPQAAFEKAVTDYNVIYKKALFFTGQGKVDESKATTPQSFEAWKRIVDTYGAAAPAGYGDTANWGAKLSDILVLEQEAVRLVEQSRYPEAHEALEHIRMMLREIRLENGITDNISDLMLTFHDEMEIVAEAKTQAEARPSIAGLVKLLAPIKGYSSDAAYAAKVGELERIVEQLRDARTEQDFTAAQGRIKPSFISLYMQFG